MTDRPGTNLGAWRPARDVSQVDVPADARLRGGRRGRSRTSSTRERRMDGDAARRLPFALNRPRRTRGPGLVVVVVARGHAVHDRRMTRAMPTPGTQSISVRQRVAASRFASHHVRLGPVRRVPRLASRLANRRCQPRRPPSARSTTEPRTAGRGVVAS